MNIQESVFVEIYLGDQIGIALVKTVFAHKGLDGNADFFIDIEWLKLRRKDPSTGFEIYIPTKLDSFNKPWQTIFPINSIMSTVFLEHYCTKHCVIQGKKIIHGNNKEFIFNDIFNQKTTIDE